MNIKTKRFFNISAMAVIILFSASAAVFALENKAPADGFQNPALTTSQNLWAPETLFQRHDLFAGNFLFAPPAPDFSAMEKWYEIVKYEYPDPPERDMTIYIKPKVDLDKRMTVFKMEFLDADGIIVGVDPAWICCSTQFGYTETGKVGKVTVQVPSERELGRVVSATVVRIKDNY